MKVAIAALTVLSGCYTTTSVSGMTALPEQVARTAATATQISRAVDVGEVSGGMPQELLSPTVEVENEALHQALEASLREAGLLASSSESARYRLDATLVSLRQPTFGFDMTVSAAVWCKLTDLSSGQVVWQDTIARAYKAHLFDHFIGTERLRLASEGALRETIVELIVRISGVHPAGSLSVSALRRR